MLCSASETGDFEDVVRDKIFTHFNGQFSDPTGWDPPRWIFMSRLGAQNLLASRASVANEIAGLKDGKSCPSSSPVVSEMLRPIVGRSISEHNPLDVLTHCINNDLQGCALACHGMHEYSPLDDLPLDLQRRNAQDFN